MNTYRINITNVQITLKLLLVFVARFHHNYHTQICVLDTLGPTVLMIMIKRMSIVDGIHIKHGKKISQKVQVDDWGGYQVAL